MARSSTLIAVSFTHWMNLVEAADLSRHVYVYARAYTLACVVI
jgi:hypothetical protein